MAENIILKEKIRDLANRVQLYSITPQQLGTILEEMLDAMPDFDGDINSITELLQAEVRALQHTDQVLISRADNLESVHEIDIERIDNDMLEKADRSELESLRTDVENLVAESSQNVQIEVDSQLDTESQHPVANSAVTAAIDELSARTVYGMTAEEDEEGGRVVLRLLDREDNVIADCDIPMGSGGGGGGGSDATSLVLTPRVNRAEVKEGSSVTLTYDYDVVYSSGEDKGESTGTDATIQVTVENGGTLLLDEISNNVSPGRYTMEIGGALLPGRNKIQVKATWTDAGSGEQRTRSKYTTVEVVQLTLTSDYNAESMLRGGGCPETIALPVTVTGNGTKSVQLYVDGEQADSRTVEVSQPTTVTFNVSTAAMAPGQHSLQVVARRTTEGGELRSESLYWGIFKGPAASGIVLSLRRADGSITEGSGHLQPELSVRAFEAIDFTWGAWGESVPVAAVIEIDGVQAQSLSVGREMQTYTGRISREGHHTLSIHTGSTTLTLGMQVSAGSITIEEASYGRVARLTAAGRSNSEAAGVRSTWADGTVTTTFVGVDWASSGWTGKSLRLLNGAKATVNWQPFAVDTAREGVKVEGRTIEMTVRISNITDEERPLIHCIDGGKGFSIQGSEIAFKTGQIIEYKDEDGEDRQREAKLSTNYVSGSLMKVALVIDKLSDRPVMHLYLDGNRCGADTYPTMYSFRQEHPQGITFDSTAGDIEIESIRLYERALSDDEELENDIADMTDTTAMTARYNDNDILGQTGGVDRAKLRAKGKGVMVIVRPDLLENVYMTNNKKTDFPATVMYYSPFGPEYDFVCRNCYIRIQGTSSTKYPSKNIRVYMSKGEAGTPELTVGGRVSSNNKYRLRPGAIAMNLFTAKSDYSDSSMSLNTGGAKLFNDIFIELGLLTPPQRWQRDRGESITIRSAIDGVPIDMFAAATESSEAVYVGQYNFNNEKSKSEKIFGMELEGYTPACPITLESLNNTETLCLFDTSAGVDEALDAGFDKAFEFNYPEDTFWGQEALTKNGKGSLASEAQRTAVRRLMAFIHESVPAGADTSDLTTFDSAYFRQHVSEYFDVNHLLTYYLWTDFFVSVDQRAKNIMWRTWDGLKWYPTYYDGDTQRGKSNDSFMSYGPETDRDTWDARRTKYAFEGHDSWLWCLCLANLQSEMSACARLLRDRLTPERTLSMLLDEQSGNWSDRAFNKSGEIKYITPAVQTTYGSTWPFIYALQGADRQHSEWFIRQRWGLLDSKFAMGNYTADSIDCYFARSASDAPDVLRVTGAKTYSYGYGSNNQPNLYTTGIVPAGRSATVPITGAFTVNDPLRIYGASRIRELDMTGASGHIKNGFDIGRCAVLERLDVHVPAGGEASSAWWLANINRCGVLRYLDLTGQTHASTAQGQYDLDLSRLTRMETLLADGTSIATFSLAEGAAIRTLTLPGTVTVLPLRYLPNLTPAGLTIQSMASVQVLEVTGCPGLNAQTIVSRWLSEKTTSSGACTLTLDGINWELSTADLLMSMAEVGTRNITGTVTVTGDLRSSEIEALRQAYGASAFVPGGELYINLTGGEIVADTTTNPELIACCISNGWLTAGSTYLTRQQAAGITHKPRAFAGSGMTHFDEFKYFTAFAAGWMANTNNSPFYEMTTLQSVTLPPTLTTIPAHGFFGCKGLEQFVVPDTVTAIGDYAFFNCTFSYFEMPATLQSIGSKVFHNALKLGTIVCKAPTPPTALASPNGTFNSGDTGWSVGSQVPAGSRKFYSPNPTAYQSAPGWADLGNHLGFTYEQLI